MSTSVLPGDPVVKKSKLYRCPVKLIPVLDPAKRSSKQFGPIKCYAVNTCKGIIRAYNEDRVSIVLNLQQPEGKKSVHWPSASFFAVRLSHTGIRRPRRQQLCRVLERATGDVHHRRQRIPGRRAQRDPERLPTGRQRVRGEGLQDCGHIGLLRVLRADGRGQGLRLQRGRQQGRLLVRAVRALHRRDGRPQAAEPRREEAHRGGRREGLQVGAGHRRSINQEISSKYPLVFRQWHWVEGPWRVSPGKLSVGPPHQISRSFGDICAKSKSYGGNPQVLISTPDIVAVDLGSDLDFLAIVCRPPSPRRWRRRRLRVERAGPVHRRAGRQARGRAAESARGVRSGYKQPAHRSDGSLLAGQRDGRPGRLRGPGGLRRRAAAPCSPRRRDLT